MMRRLTLADGTGVSALCLGAMCFGKPGHADRRDGRSRAAIRVVLRRSVR